MTPTKKVKHYIDTTGRRSCTELDEPVGLLIGEHIDVEEAECLIAFVPIAFAHAVLTQSRSGVCVQPGFIARYFDSGKTVHGQLVNEPIFLAARALAVEMLQGSDFEAQRAGDIADSSAEMNVVRQLAGDSGDLTGIILTEPLLSRVPIEHVRRNSPRFRWRFWK